MEFQKSGFTKSYKKTRILGWGRGRAVGGRRLVSEEGRLLPRLLVAVGLAVGSVTSHVSFLLCI